MVDQGDLAMRVLGRVAKRCAESLLGCTNHTRSLMLPIYGAGWKEHDDKGPMQACWNLLNLLVQHTLSYKQRNTAL